jgi:hypothetical protein
MTRLHIGQFHVPLAETKSVTALLQVKVNVLFVVSIRSWPEHRGKACARAGFDAFAHCLVHEGIGELIALAVSQLEGTDIDGIGAAMFADRRVRNVVTRPALIRTIIFYVGQLRPEREYLGGEILADPLAKLDGQSAAERRCWLELDSVRPLENHRMDPHEIISATSILFFDRREQLRNRQVGRRQLKKALRSTERLLRFPGCIFTGLRRPRSRQRYIFGSDPCQRRGIHVFRPIHNREGKSQAKGQSCSDCSRTSYGS